MEGNNMETNTPGLHLPRSLRNNNPTNITVGARPWVGQCGRDGRFCVFKNNIYGYRATFLLLNTYNKVHHIYSVREIISRWAPPSDGNNTRGYIQRVCKITGLKETDIIVAQPSDGDPYDVIMLVYAMALVETGDRYKNLIDRAEICKGYELAFNTKL